VNSWITGGEKFIRQQLVNYLDGSTNRVNIFYCIGNTNPNAPTEALDTLNFELPKSIAKASIDLPIRLITFGSVHEESKISNPYMDSKRKFRDYLVNQDSNFNWNHFQLHTLYSEMLPKPYMFLGQMLQALSVRGKFKMSSGTQLRQFHHTSDVVDAIDSLLPGIEVNSVLQVSSNDSIRLVDLASTIFLQLGELEKLEIGTLTDRENEVYSDGYPVFESLKNHSFRNPLMEIPRISSDVWLPKLAS
jgi:nucleoside-diphosphate-sugar epimerase